MPLFCHRVLNLLLPRDLNYRRFAHMALAIEDYSWFNLQLTRADITLDGSTTP
jgi:hypothetical protein